MFDIHIEEIKKAVIIHLAGSFYSEEIFDVKTIWKRILGSRPGTIAINFSELDYIDSSAIANLINFSNEAREKDTPLIFYALRPAMIDLFKKAKLDRFFKILTKEDFEFAISKK
jgi:anti-anti-sigma factor